MQESVVAAVQNEVAHDVPPIREDNVLSVVANDKPVMVTVVLPLVAAFTEVRNVKDTTGESKVKSSREVPIRPPADNETGTLIP
jgi:hypothetical protein